jgi:hypothetical protein
VSLWATTNLTESLWAVYKLTSVRLLASQGNFLAQLPETKLFQVLSLFKQPKPLADNLTLRLIEAGLQKLGHELFEDGS